MMVFEVYKQFLQKNDVFSSWIRVRGLKKNPKKTENFEKKNLF